MTLHDFRSKSLNLADGSTPKQTNPESRMNFESSQTLNWRKLSYSGKMQKAIMQVAIKAVTATVEAMREADPPAKLHTRRSILEEYHRPRQVGTMLNQAAFDWKVPDRYVDLLNFKMEQMCCKQECIISMMKRSSLL